MIELYETFSRTIEETANPSHEPFLGEYHDKLQELNEAIVKTGENIEGSLFNANKVTSLPELPFEAFLYKRRNFVRYISCGTKLLEIGFNAGHSALLALTANPNLYYVGIDIGKYEYTKIAFKILKRHFGDRIKLIIGDSRDLLPRTPTDVFDLIHIDGGHSATVSHSDLASIIKVAKLNSHILFDDASASYIIPVISFYILTGVLSSETLPGFWEHIRPGIMPDQVLLRVCRKF